MGEGVDSDFFAAIVGYIAGRDAAFGENGEVEVFVAHAGSDRDPEPGRGSDGTAIDRHAKADYGVRIGEQALVTVPVDGVVVEPRVDDLGVDLSVDGALDVEVDRVVAAIGVQDAESGHPR